MFQIRFTTAALTSGDVSISRQGYRIALRTELYKRGYPAWHDRASRANDAGHFVFGLASEVDQLVSTITETSDPDTFHDIVSRFSPPTELTAASTQPDA